MIAGGFDGVKGVRREGGRRRTTLLLRGRAEACGILPSPGSVLTGCAEPPKAAPQALQVGLAICVKPHRGHLTLAAIGPSSSIRQVGWWAVSPDVYSFAPALLSTFTISAWPFYAASIMAVLPRRVFAFTSAPLSDKIFTMSA